MKKYAVLALLILLVAPAARAADPWWKHAVIYEIYPRSFQDSNGDGVGDLKGIESRLDYLSDLGIDAIWISPMYPSPQVDFGYDITDYEAVDPQYGTLDDMDRLIDRARQKHIRVVLDMVLNHTSDRHRWFQAAASSRSDPKHDWYVWSDGVPGSGPMAHEGRLPPNNWISLFGGSAWEWVPAVHQYYYHFFYKEQPDLNWRNPAVEQAMFGSVRFWLDRGVAGFRLDAVGTLFEDPGLRDARELGGTNDQGDPRLDDSLVNNLPEVHDVIRRLRALIDSYPGDRVLIGETYMPDTKSLATWYGARQDELQLPMDMTFGFHGNRDKLDVATFRDRIEEAQSLLHGGQPLFVFDNHDNVRSLDRYGDGVHDGRISKILATLLLTTRATALMYYGEELDMRTTTPARRQDVKDPIGITGWPKEKGRDGERTPMQWDGGPQAGFSSSPVTWLPIPPSYRKLNVETESKDPRSALRWYRQLIALRRSEPALRDGTITMLDRANTRVLSYLRRADSGDAIVVAMNFTAQPQAVSLDLPGVATSTPVETILTDASELRKIRSTRGLKLPPYATWIARLR